MGYHLIKLSPAKMMCLCLGLCVLLGTLCLTGSFTPLVGQAVAAGAGADFDANTPEGRVSFLESYGWKIDPTPTLVKEITLPKTFDPVYTRYNEDIQQPEGFDLRRYAGSKATLYVYTVLNHPSEEEVSANLLVCDGTVIGGDLCSARLDGFMHGFTPVT